MVGDGARTADAGKTGADAVFDAVAVAAAAAAESDGGETRAAAAAAAAEETTAAAAAVRGANEGRESRERARRRGLPKVARVGRGTVG